MANISFEGRLTADADIKYAASGKPYARFTVAENFREQNKQTQEWEDSGATFHNVTLFGRLAESAPLTKGTVVNVSGTQKSRAYEKDGEKRNWTETTTNTVGIVPIPPRNNAPSPSPQGEGFGAQQGYPAPQQSPAPGSWPQTAQQTWGQPQNQGGYDDPPF